MEIFDDGLEQLSGTFEILDVLVSDQIITLRAIQKVVHHTGFACTARCGNQNVLGPELFPDLLNKWITKPKIPLFDWCPGIKITARVTRTHFHTIRDLHHFCRTTH